MKKTTAQENIAKLPPECLGTLPSTREVILLKAGESGYWPFKKSPPLGTQTTEQFVNEMNTWDGITIAQRMAMEHGSMFGYGCPAANPDNYNEAGNFLKEFLASAGASH